MWLDVLSVTKWGQRREGIPWYTRYTWYITPHILSSHLLLLLESFHRMSFLTVSVSQSLSLTVSQSMWSLHFLLLWLLLLSNRVLPLSKRHFLPSFTPILWYVCKSIISPSWMTVSLFPFMHLTHGDDDLYVDLIGVSPQQWWSFWCVVVLFRFAIFLFLSPFNPKCHRDRKR